MLRLVVLVLALFGAQPAAASDVESLTLFSKGAWETRLFHGTSSGNTWCDAGTSKGPMRMGIAGWPDGSISLTFFDARWYLAERQVPVEVHVDYEIYTASGRAYESIVFVDIDGEDGMAFVRDVMDRSALAPLNQEGRRLATFSLAGSSAAMLTFFDCWARILGNESAGVGRPLSKQASSADPF